MSHTFATDLWHIYGNCKIVVKWFEISYKILQLLVIVAISVSKLMFSSSDVTIV